ncbi:hypothetical protein E2C01_064472 [Portunus trituberculatus]|uniref:Uncharacterized protein n=1 Tax=Portunus trituberculatus TaxID=210409 RepID=A0A5B7HKE8_PORTR|nr:hypothetical protein [Portunus trituberculatus]
MKGLTCKRWKRQKREAGLNGSRSGRHSSRTGEQESSGHASIPEGASPPVHEPWPAPEPEPACEPRGAHRVSLRGRHGTGVLPVTLDNILHRLILIPKVHRDRFTDRCCFHFMSMINDPRLNKFVTNFADSNDIGNRVQNR